MELTTAQQIALAKWAKIRPKLAQVKKSDSQEEIENKQKTNKSFLDQSEKDNGLSDLTTLEIVNKMASDAFEVRKYTQAEALYKRLFVSTQETYTPCSEKVAVVLKVVANVAVRRGQLLEATETLRRVREIRLNLGLKPGDTPIVELTKQIIHLCVSKRLYDDALIEVDGIISASQDKLGPMHDETLRWKEIKANMWRQKDRHASEVAASITKDVARSRKAKRLLKAYIKRRSNDRRLRNFDNLALELELNGY